VGWKHLDQRRFTIITLSASFTLRLLTYPMSLLKTNRQTQFLTKSKLESLSVSAQSQSIPRRIWSTQGLRGFYKGITTNLIGNSAHVVYATVYETTREWIETRLLAMDWNINSNHSSSSSIAVVDVNGSCSNLITPFASGLGGICASTSQLCLSTPFDITSQKRMVLEGDGMYTVRARDIVRQIVAEEGSVLGMWRGLTLSLMTYAPTSGIVWASYRWTKPKFHEWFFDGENTNYLMLNFMAGGISGGLGGLLTMPLDTVKVRKQVLARRSTRSIGIVKDVHGELGIFGFFRGVIPRTCQYTITCAIIMTVYDWVKRMSRNEVTL